MGRLSFRSKGFERNGCRSENVGGQARAVGRVNRPFPLAEPARAAAASARDLLDEVRGGPRVDSEGLGHLDDELTFAGAEDAVGREHADGHRETELAGSLVAETCLER